MRCFICNKSGDGANALAIPISKTTKIPKTTKTSRIPTNLCLSIPVFSESFVIDIPKFPSFFSLNIALKIVLIVLFFAKHSTTDMLPILST